MKEIFPVNITLPTSCQKKDDKRMRSDIKYFVVHANNLEIMIRNKCNLKTSFPKWMNTSMESEQCV